MFQIKREVEVEAGEGKIQQPEQRQKKFLAILLTKQSFITFTSLQHH